MKDEIPNDATLEGCILKVKAYCYIKVKVEEERKNKGITKAAIKYQIIIEDF